MSEKGGWRPDSGSEYWPSTVYHLGLASAKDLDPELSKQVIVVPVHRAPIQRESPRSFYEREVPPRRRVMDQSGLRLSHQYDIFVAQRVEDAVLDAIRRDRPMESIGFLHGIEGESNGVPWVEFKQASMLSAEEGQMITSPTRVEVTNPGILAVWEEQLRLREAHPDIMTRGVGHGHPISGLSDTDITLGLVHGDLDILLVANNTLPNPQLECYRRIKVGDNAFRIIPWHFYEQTESFKYIGGKPTKA